MSQPRKTKSISRRTFVKTLGAGAAIAGLPLILHADDKAGSAKPILGSGEHTYEAIHGWAQVPEGMHFGNTHMVQEDAQGRILVHHQNGAPTRCSFSIPMASSSNRGEPSGARAPRHAASQRRERRIFISGHDRAAPVVKTNSTAKRCLSGVSQRRQECRGKPCYQNEKKYIPTNIAFAPNGDFYVADGYGSYFVHRYNIKGDYISTFGGKGTDDGQLRTRTEFGAILVEPQPKILVADRSNERLQWFDLDGKHLVTLTPEENAFRKPCHFDQRNGELLLPGLDGRVSILDADNKQVAILGDNADANNAAKTTSAPKSGSPACLSRRTVARGIVRQHFHYRMGFRRPGHQVAKSRRVT